MGQKDAILLYGTCQATALAEMLTFSPELTRRFSVSAHLNVTGPGRERHEMPCTDEELAKCTVFIYHETKSARLREIVKDMKARLPKGALTLRFPYITSNLYWPMQYTAAIPLGVSEEAPYGVISFRSPVLDVLLEKGDRQAAIAAYEAYDPTSWKDTEELKQSTFSYWERLDRECPDLSVSGFLRERWQKELLFYLFNHPAKAVYRHVANQILGILGYPRLPKAVEQKNCCYDGYILPIHPNVAREYGLSFGPVPFLYKGKTYSFKEFLVFYAHLAGKEPGISTRYGLE